MPRTRRRGALVPVPDAVQLTAVRQGVAGRAGGRDEAGAFQGAAAREVRRRRARPYRRQTGVAMGELRARQEQFSAEALPSMVGGENAADLTPVVVEFEVPGVAPGVAAYTDHELGHLGAGFEGLGQLGVGPDEPTAGGAGGAQAQQGPSGVGVRYDLLGLVPLPALGLGVRARGDGRQRVELGHRGVEQQVPGVQGVPAGRARVRDREARGRPATS